MAKNLRGDLRPTPGIVGSGLQGVWSATGVGPAHAAAPSHGLRIVGCDGKKSNAPSSSSSATAATAGRGEQRGRKSGRKTRCRDVVEEGDEDAVGELDE